MPPDKFIAISRFLHFTDNIQAPSRDDSDHDQLWKIRPVIEVVKEQSSKAYVLGKKVSIDESMIGTKCRLAFIQYMPKKPTKWGIKYGSLQKQKQDTSITLRSIQENMMYL